MARPDSKPDLGSRGAGITGLRSLRLCHQPSPEEESATLYAEADGGELPDTPHLDGFATDPKFAFSTSSGMRRFGCVSIECPKTKQLI